MFCEPSQSREAEGSESVNTAEGRMGSAGLSREPSVNHSAELEVVLSGGGTS